MSTSRLLTGDALIKHARELGVSTEGERPELGADGVVNYTPVPASEREIQRRVMGAERHLRERRLLMLTMASVALGAGVGIGGLWATVHNGKLQTENAKRLLSVQLEREFDQRFESESMRRSRAELAAALLRGAAPPTDDVQDFFETVGYYVRQGALDSAVVWNDFGDMITHYWPALTADIETERRQPDGDPEDYVNFEWLNTMLLEEAARRRHVPVAKLIPSATDVRDFLKDETELVPQRKAGRAGVRRR